MFSLSNTQIRPSRTLLFIYCGVHLLALLSVSILTLDWFTQLICILVITAIFFLYLSESVLLSSQQSVSALSWSAEERSMQIRLKNDQLLYATELKQRVVTPLMVCLLVQVEERYFPLPVVIFRDSCSEIEFRRLRVLAFHGKIRIDDLGGSN